MPAIHPQHEDRQTIQDEAHARPPMPIEKSSAQAWHWVLHAPAGQCGLWPDAFDRAARHQLIACDDGVIRFERHTEFAAITFFGEDGLPDLTGSNISLDNVEAFKIGASSSLMGAGVSATAPAATAKRAAPTAASPVLLSAAGVATLAATASSGGDPRADLRFSPQ